MVILTGVYNHYRSVQSEISINNRMTEMSNNIMLRVNKYALQIQGVQRIIDSSRHIDPQISYMYAEHIVKTANRYKYISVSLLTSILFHESHFNPFAESPAGAMGMGQHMPGTFYMICREWNMVCSDSTIFDYEFSIEATAWYLDFLYKIPKSSKGDIEKVVAFYNGGYKQAYRWGLYRRYEAGLQLDSLEMKLKDILYEETKKYVIGVMDKDSVFQKRINRELPTNT
jgi:soluble lytic murein transglycosylase-like protein